VEAAAVGAARQAAHVVDGAPLAGRVRDAPERVFEPRPDPCLQEARDRVAALRELALEGVA
ncbi:MAG TPA: hypothetical protein VHK06_05215, partial [Candidatus Limnocylindria bacterium]|nr:hypothetical protein [Candidatus Limnocylindria bacterium]